ncbi:MAG: type I pullulanase, partial [Clostridium sp.]|nr:type I pullulanase [Clostridium sp.]
MLSTVELKKLYSSEEFVNKYNYTKNDLGITYSRENTKFKVWSPLAERIVLNLYKSGNYNEEDKICSYEMEPSNNGTFEKTIYEDLNKVYYDYTAYVNGEVNQTNDPYAIACGVNGKRSMVVDLKRTNPENWGKDNGGEYYGEYPVIYELHIKDFSYDKASGIKDEYRGK